MAGPFYLAYVNEGTTFNPAVHNVEDEEVYSFSIEQGEGDFAALEIELKNPRVGALSAGRKQWAIFSYDTAWIPTAHTAVIVPLFVGRVVAVPNNIQDTEISLSFIARPNNFVAQKETIAAAMRLAGRPNWDPIWFDPEKVLDPDNVLESQPKLWHTDRVSLVVSASHITNAEDGNIDITADDGFYDGMQTSYGDVPLRTINLKAAVDWDMVAATSFDISTAFSSGALGAIYTFTGEGLVSSWPKSGHNLGNGWKVDVGLCERIDTNGPNVYYFRIGAVPNAEFPYTYRSPFDPQLLIYRVHNYEGVANVFVPSWLENYRASNGYISHILAVQRWICKPTMIVGYDVNRKYSEEILISLSADVQNIKTDAGGQDVLNISMTSSYLASPVDPGGALPIGDVRRRAYFTQDRGAWSIEYLIAIMRARLLARSRTVSVTVSVPFAFGVAAGLSCRKSVTLHDPRLPGGLISGKIIRYKLALDGDSGEATCEIVIGCCVGKGNTVVAVAGTNVYVDGVLEDGIQAKSGSYIMPFAGEVIYQPLLDPPNDDGVDLLGLSPDNVIKSLLIENDEATQRAVIPHGCDQTSDAFKPLEAVPTRFTLVMKPVTGGPFLTSYTVATSDLMIPKHFDLEAA
jgi:hypothetical protein